MKRSIMAVNMSAEAPRPVPNELAISSVPNELGQPNPVKPNDRKLGKLGTVGSIAGGVALTAAACTPLDIARFEQNTGIDIPQPLEQTLQDFRLPQLLDDIVVDVRDGLNGSEGLIARINGGDVTNGGEGTTNGGDVIINPEPEIDPNSYTLKKFLKLKDPKLDKTGFKNILEKNAPLIVAYRNTHGYPDLTVDIYIKSAMDNLNYDLRGKTMGHAGNAIAISASGMLLDSQSAAKAKSFRQADAFQNYAHALIRIGKSEIEFKKSPRELDTQLRKVAKALGVK